MLYNGGEKEELFVIKYERRRKR